jgi:putative phage-type endonuclease
MEEINQEQEIQANEQEDSSESSESSDSSDSSESSEFLEQLNENERAELEATIEDVLHHYVEQHLIQYSSPKFMKTMIANVTHSVLEDLISAGICTENDEDELATYVEECADMICDIEGLVPREEPHFIEEETPQNKENLHLKIEWLRNQPQPAQRTPEWYQFRQNLITASNIWKAFASECQQNSLIYEKCQPIDTTAIPFGLTSVGSSVHWGVKYEALTVMLYEDKFGVKVEEFGCIRHSTYDFIGASPDGVVTNPASPLYGRMIEIKNIVNREIDGVPSEAYWVQMQLQMETCNLEACDFVETQFKEYDSVEKFWYKEDDEEKDEKNRGIVLMFYPLDIHAAQVPVYSFMPLHIPLTIEDTMNWIAEEEKVYLGKGYGRKDMMYWYLEVFSCVTVRRNRQWFATALPAIENIWKTVLEERGTGYEHRAPKKRGKKDEKEVGSVLQNYIHVNKIDS